MHHTTPDLLLCAVLMERHLRPAQWARVLGCARVPREGALADALALAATHAPLWRRLAQAVDDALASAAGPNLAWRRASGLPLERASGGAVAWARRRIPALGEPAWSDAQRQARRCLLEASPGRVELLGPPGVGKSTLVASALYERAARHGEPVIWVDAGRGSLRDGLASFAEPLFGPLRVRVDERAHRVRLWIERRGAWCVVDHADRALRDPEEARWLPRRGRRVILAREPLEQGAAQIWLQSAAVADNPCCQRLLAHLGPEHPLWGALEGFAPRRQSPATLLRAHGRAVHACLEAVFQGLDPEATELALLWSLLGPEVEPVGFSEEQRQRAAGELSRAGLVDLETWPRHLPQVTREFVQLRTEPAHLARLTARWLGQLRASGWSGQARGALARLGLAGERLDLEAERALARLVLDRALEAAAVDDPAQALGWLRALVDRWPGDEAAALGPMQVLLHYQLGGAYLALLAAEPAADAFGRALELLQSSPRSAGLELLEFRVLRRLAHVLVGLGRHEEAGAHGARLEALGARYGAAVDQ